MRKLAFLLTSLLVLTTFILTIGCDRIEQVRENRSTATPTPTTAPTSTQTPAATPTPPPTPSSTVPPMTSLPCRFRGTVLLNGAPVVDGTVITAVIAGDTHTTTTPSAYGGSTYVLKITSPAGVTYSAGTLVTFTIGDRVADQTSTWEIGGNIELNLSAG